MATLPRLVVIGAGGFGREVWAWATQSVQFEREWTLKGFIDDNLNALRDKPSPGKILDTLKDYAPAAEDVFVCALGVPASKKKCTELIAARGGRFTQLHHRTAVLGNEVTSGDGVILCPFSVVSANNRLGRGVVLNLHATVDHDAEVGDWTQINCHCDLTASVKVGQEVFFGSSCSVIPNVSIGDRAYIGAGSVVLRNVAADTKVVGVPARRIG